MNFNLLTLLHSIRLYDGDLALAGDANCWTHMKTYVRVDAAIQGKINLGFAFAIYDMYIFIVFLQVGNLI